MFSIWQTKRQLQLTATDRLRFIGFGIRHRRFGVEQIIPNIYNLSEHYSLIFNHDAVRVNIDGDITELPAHTLTLWDQSCRVFYGAPKQHWTLSWLQCRGEAIEQLLREHRTPLNFPVAFDGERLISHYWIPIFEECSEHLHPDVPVILNFIKGIFLEIDRSLRRSGDKDAKIPETFRSLRSYMEDHYTEKLTLDDLAARIHLAPVYFSRKFKEYFGIAPIDYVIALRLNDAALYLRNPDLTIQEVGEQVGYQDGLHFSKLFKRHFGSSPQLFRARLFKDNTGIGNIAEV